MTNRREFLLMLTAGLVAAAVVITPVIAEEFFGTVTKVDMEGKTLTVLKKGGEEIEIKTTDSTEISATKGEMDLEKLARFVKKQEESGKHGASATITAENHVASRVLLGAFTVLAARPVIANVPKPRVAPPLPGPSQSQDGTRPGEERDDNSVKMKFCWCPPGTFLMGSPSSEPEREKDEGPAIVTLSRGFWMGKYEVTQSQWQTVMGASAQEQLAKAKGPALRGEGPEYPIYDVNLDEAVEFCRRLTETERRAGRLPAGWEYRLPTDAQWEYACRAGTTTATAFGDRVGSQDANCDGRFPYNGAAKGPYLERTAPVRGYRPNAWGLHDMPGNVWEWCGDGYAVALPGGVDPVGPSDAALWVIRGGGWFSSGWGCRSANRYGFDPADRCSDLGLRVARVPSGE
jgi:formylglycine-generating enzyme required for sulfatase activity